MKPTIGSALLIAFALAGASPALAQQDYPARPIRVIVGYPPGGTLDNPARVLAQELAKQMGQEFVVENKPGASANIAADYVAKAAPDGYTLLLSSSSLSSSGALYKNLSFDASKDFKHIAGFCTLPTVIVARNDLPADTLQEVVALARQKPGQLTFGSPGTGTGAHISGEVLKRFAKIDMTHIPFKGAAQAMTNVSGGHVDLGIGGLATYEGAIQNKLVKPLAVTNPDPSPALIDAPTVTAALEGVDIPRDYQFYTWLGLSAPAGTPDAVVQKLEQAVQAVLDKPNVQQAMVGIGVNPQFVSSQDLSARIASEVPAYARIVEEVGVKFD